MKLSRAADADCAKMKPSAWMRVILRRSRFPCEVHQLFVMSHDFVEYLHVSGVNPKRRREGLDIAQGKLPPSPNFLTPPTPSQ